LVKTKVRLRIIDINKQRRRVTGSVRSVLAQERKAAAEKLWGEIEEGKTYKGVVNP
jgi:4-hydroxy-3-methylbut-2-enyl diphosphate reductase